MFIALQQKSRFWHFENGKIVFWQRVSQKGVPLGSEIMIPVHLCRIQWLCVPHHSKIQFVVIFLSDHRIFFKDCICSNIILPDFKSPLTLCVKFFCWSVTPIHKHKFTSEQKSKSVSHFTYRWIHSCTNSYNSRTGIRCSPKNHGPPSPKSCVFCCRTGFRSFGGGMLSLSAP